MTKDLGPKREVTQETLDELDKILGTRAWKRIRTALMIKSAFRCCLCKGQFGASFLVIKHLSRPSRERRSELAGFRVFCSSCLD